MEIIKYYHHRGNINELAQRYHSFARLKYAKLNNAHHLRWKDQNTDYCSFQAQVAFFGKSGYGKSSTVNAFFGNSILKTSDVAACTRRCETLDFELSTDCYLSLSDFPGIGESEYKDQEYLKMYGDFMKLSLVIVYVLRADTRDYAIDQAAYQQLFSKDADKKKVIFALNYCDKI